MFRFKQALLAASVASGLSCIVLAAGCSDSATQVASSPSSQTDQVDQIDPLLKDAKAASAAGDFETAITRYKAAIALNSRSLDSWLGLGDAELAERHVAAAAEAYRSAQVIDDGNAEAAYWLGQIALREGNAAEAAAEFAHGLKTHGQDPRLNNGAGVAYALQGDDQRARYHYDAALAVDPNNPALRNNYGLLQLKTGDLEGALATFIALLRAHPTNNRYKINLAMVYLALGQTSNAVANAPGLTEEQLRRVLAAFYRSRSAPSLALSTIPAIPLPPGEKPSAATTAGTPGITAEAKLAASMSRADSASHAAMPSPPDINPAAGTTPSSIPSAVQAAIARPARPVPAGGAYRIQVGSVRSEAGAQQEWQHLLDRQRDILGDLSLVISRADLGARGVFYRIQAGPIPDAADAGRRCDELHGRSLGCLVLRP